MPESPSFPWMCPLETQTLPPVQSGALPPQCVPSSPCSPSINISIDSLLCASEASFLNIACLASFLPGELPLLLCSILLPLPHDTPSVALAPEGFFFSPTPRSGETEWSRCCRPVGPKEPEVPFSSLLTPHCSSAFFTHPSTNYLESV